jgi:predicted dehydrogenase
MAQAAAIRRVVLVGFGHHAERIYVPLLLQLARQGELELVGIVELASRAQQVERVYAAHGATPPPVTLLDDAQAARPEYVVEQLRSLHRERPFQALLVSCDPRHRRPYFDFACEVGAHVFCDKPIFTLDGIAHDAEVAARYTEELAALERSARAAGVDFVVQTQRRAHAGYRFVHQLLEECVARFDVPVTSLHVQHADGMWVLPGEWGREHHPYKYGFGKLFHSGYHFVDALAYLLRDTLQRFLVKEVEAAVQATFANDAMTVWQGHPLLDVAGARRAPITPGPGGEHDVRALLDFRDRERSVCVADLCLLQHSLSDRNPRSAVTDAYKGIGRVRHERVDVKVSSLLNVQVHSYQARSTRAAREGTGVGEADHFEVLVFRNPTFFREPAFERVDLSALAPGASVAHNELARAQLFRAFLRREPTRSALRDHLLPGALTALLYRGMAARGGRLAVVRQPLDPAWLREG